MRSLTVPQAKPTWRVASMLARRRYLGCRDETPSLCELTQGRLRTARETRRRICRDDALEVDPPPGHDAVDFVVWVGLSDLGELRQLIRRLARRRTARPVVDEPIWPEAVKRSVNRRPILCHSDSQSVAQFEREMMLERQRGRPASEAGRQVQGRAPTARAKSDDIHRLAADGVKRDDIAGRLGVGVA